MASRQLRNARFRALRINKKCYLPPRSMRSRPLIFAGAVPTVPGRVHRQPVFCDTQIKPRRLLQNISCELVFDIYDRKSV